MILSGLPILVERDGEVVSFDAVELTPEELDEYVNTMSLKQLKIAVHHLLSKLEEAPNKTSEGLRLAINLRAYVIAHMMGSSGEDMLQAWTEAIVEAMDKDEACYQNHKWIESVAKAAAAGRLDA